MHFVEQEIASQPECWRQAAALASDAAVRAALPAHGARVAVVGCGTSWFMAQVCAALRERAGAGETDAFSASDYRLGRPYEHLVAITRSGTTSEVLWLLRALRDQPHPPRLTVITTGTELPGAELADAAVAMPFADERSVVQTRFATSVLALWRAWIGRDDVERLAAAAERALALPIPERALSAERITFVGSDWWTGIAHEAALKAREAAQLWTESYSGFELRHGPISVLDADSVAWMLGPAAPDLIEDVRATGAWVVTSDADPMVELIRAQRAAVAIAHRRGLDPDQPRNLTRAVVLPDVRDPS